MYRVVVIRYSNIAVVQLPLSKRAAYTVWFLRYFGTMGKNWYFIFLIVAILAIVFPPFIAEAGMQITTRFVFIFSPVNSGARAMPYNWPILFAIEAVCLTAFAVLASKRNP